METIVNPTNSINESGLLIFHFENILLPDSTVNEAASHGYVQFRINQRLDNPIGTVVENTADIYFDFNDAIVTNTTFHTIGNNFIISDTKTFVEDLTLSAFPNPFNTSSKFTINGQMIKAGSFELYDLMGRLIKTDIFTGNNYQLNREDLQNGTYFFRFLDGQQLLATGKVVIQ